MKLQNILNAGIREDTPSYLAAKINISNILGIAVGLGVALPFGIFSLVYFPGIAFIPIVSVVVCLAVIAINQFGFYTLGRALIGLWPFILTALFGAYLAPAGEPPIAGPLALQMAFGVIPFIVFDVREKLPLILCGAVVLIFMGFMTPILNAALEKDFDIEVITTGYLYNISIITATMVGVSSVLFMAYGNHKSTIRSEELVKEMDLRNEELESSQNEMRENIKKIEENQKEEQKRNWTSEGLSKFGNLLRSNEDSEQLYDQLISGITKYVKANQGALFLVNRKEDGDVTIDLQSCYAYNRKKHVEKSILPGQGLLGQSFLEKDIIMLKEVPEDYLSITSGLGEALPRMVLIVPLLINEEVEGLFEIASFQSFEEHEMAFLKDLGSNVASFISINRINEKTKYLLEETQQQAEEMRSQEEEMRQNMEELQATQEEMQRKEREYIDRINELEQASGVEQT